MPTKTSSPDCKKNGIVVVGIGGAGGNAIDNMIKKSLQGVDFLATNTDAQALDRLTADDVIHLGAKATKGLGAGSDPSIGKIAAEESIEQIGNVIEKYNMVFITAGMGGGTGTGAAPVIAQNSKEKGVLTVAIVSRPFEFEGAKRMKVAEQGIAELEKHVDTILVIPNQNLFALANERTTLAEAFALADEVLYAGVAGITDLMVRDGLINLDFADVKAIMSNKGRAMMGNAIASGENRAKEATLAAIANPLLDGVSIAGAKGVLISIMGARDNLTLYEIEQAATIIREKVDQSANIIFGAIFDDQLQEKISVSVVATGMQIKQKKSEQQQNIENKKIQTHHQQEKKQVNLKKYDYYQKDKSTQNHYQNEDHNLIDALHDEPLIHDEPSIDEQNYRIDSEKNISIRQVLPSEFKQQFLQKKSQNKQQSNSKNNEEQENLTKKEKLPDNHDRNGIKAMRKKILDFFTDVSNVDEQKNTQQALQEKNKLKKIEIKNENMYQQKFTTQYQRKKEPQLPSFLRNKRKD